MKSFIITLIISVLLIIGYTVLFTAIKRTETACLTQVETRYNYIERKMCDPTKPDPCYIEPNLQMELEMWKLEEMNKCK